MLNNVKVTSLIALHNVKHKQCQNNINDGRTSRTEFLVSHVGCSKTLHLRNRFPFHWNYKGTNLQFWVDGKDTLLLETKLLGLVGKFSSKLSVENGKFVRDMKNFAIVIILMSVNYELTLSEFDDPPSGADRSPTINNQHYQFHNDYENENSFTVETENEDAALHNALNRGPYFDISASKNVTALVGNTAYLNCRVRNLGNKTITWIRHRDLHLLTVGKETYTQDQRFQSVHNPHNGDWSLKVMYPQQRDSGVYECQIGTSPPVGYSMLFSVVEPITTIIGQPDMYIDTGSTINLTCIVKHLPEPPPGIYWTHNGEEINYDSPRGGVSVITEKGDITTSYLLIQRARSSDSGKYICLPSNANAQNINVHVLNGEHPAAIQRASQLEIRSYLLIIISLIATVLAKR